MRLTGRDRKILIILLVLALPLGYWFLLISPKRDQQGKLQGQLTQARSAEQTASQRLAGLTAAKRSFASDYTTVIRLGKSIPSTLDMSSLLFQLDTAAGGEHIDFSSVTSGARSSAPTPSGSSASAPGGAGTPPSTPSGPTTPASSTAGSSAGQTSSTSNSSGVPGLDSVPITFEFDGNFFDLANFFHQVKRFVQVTNNQISVSGRLITINNLEFKLPQSGGQGTSGSGGGTPSMMATVSATVYLAPKSLGDSAGASPSGPSATPSGAATPASGSSAPSSAPAAAAVAR